MCPEYGATIAFFPPDKTAINYLEQTGRDASTIQYTDTYLKAVKLFRNDYQNAGEDPVYTEVFELDLTTITSCLSGPKRPQDRVPVSEMKSDFEQCLTNKVGFKGYGLNPDSLTKSVPFMFEAKVWLLALGPSTRSYCILFCFIFQEYLLKHGAVVISAITSCTNTSNPSVMLGAGLLAKKAVERGLSVPPYIKTSMSPGSGVVTYYLQESGVTPYLQQLGFDVGKDSLSPLW